MSNLTNAQPYAKAAFTHALNSNNLEHWEAFMSRIDTAVNHPNFSTVITNPTLPDTEKISLLTDCLQPEAEEMASFLTVLVHNRRLNLLKEVVEKFNALSHTHKGLTPATITTAQPLDPQCQQTLVSNLENTLDTSILPTFQTDQSIIDGLTIQYGDTIVDGSLKHILKQLSYNEGVSP